MRHAYDALQSNVYGHGPKETTRKLAEIAYNNGTITNGEEDKFVRRMKRYMECPPNYN